MSSPATVMITGASSGVGLYATEALVRRGWHVVMACRDVNKAASAAESLGLSAEQVSPMQIDLGSLASVRSFVVAVAQQKITFDALVCNAAIYLPRLQKPQRSPEGFEISVATNHLGHFLKAVI